MLFLVGSFPVDKDIPEGENIVLLKCALIEQDYQKEPLHKNASVISHNLKTII